MFLKIKNDFLGIVVGKKTGYTQLYSPLMAVVFKHVNVGTVVNVQVHRFKKQWSGMVQPPKTISSWDTGVPVDTLKFVGAKSCCLPHGFVSSLLFVVNGYLFTYYPA